MLAQGEGVLIWIATRNTRIIFLSIPACEGSNQVVIAK